MRAIKGSTRLEAKKQRRREGRESGRRRPPVITESEFLARRESVERTMVVRQRGDRTQIAVLEDDVLVEHYVNRTSHQSYVGNVYLGKVQNVLPSMEAAFVDIGKGSNAVLYAGEVNFDASGLEGQPKRIESALKAGQSVIVQVTKDPVGHKGARLTSQVSLPGRYLVYVPGASMTGISRKLPENERTRLKSILKKVTPEHAGVIVRTAAEGAAETELDLDITRLAAQWEAIEKKAKTASAPALLHGEPDLTVRVIRDVFNEDFAKLIVSGDEGWEIIDEYVRFVAPHLADRISRWDNDDDPADDVFAAYRIDEQLMKALERKVWLPSGGSLVIDRTEAMTVIDVNTGKFTGQGGNLEETVTRNNLEAAEEIVRQLRLRDVGGIVVIDFIDMVLESNRDLVLRRLTECLARDRTKHQVAEVTSLGLVQMTRKRVGAGLLEAFSTQCECCSGRGVILTLEVPAETAPTAPRRAPPAGPSRPRRPMRAMATATATAAAAGTAPTPGRPTAGQATAGPAAGPTTTGAPPPPPSRARPWTTPPGTTPRWKRPRSTTLPWTAGRTATSVPVLDAAPADTISAMDDAARNADAVEDTGARGSTRNGGRRTRRPTNGGTAFAAAVNVEDSPAPAVVVPVVTEVPETAPDAGAFVSVAATTGDATATEDSEAPVRRTRTRAGFAVARVTIVSDPDRRPRPPRRPSPRQPAAAATRAEARPSRADRADRATPAEATGRGRRRRPPPEPPTPSPTPRGASRRRRPRPPRRAVAAVRRGRRALPPSRRPRHRAARGTEPALRPPSRTPAADPRHAGRTGVDLEPDPATERTGHRAGPAVASEASPSTDGQRSTPAPAEPEAPPTADLRSSGSHPAADPADAPDSTHRSQGDGFVSTPQARPPR